MVRLAGLQRADGGVGNRQIQGRARCSRSQERAAQCGSGYGFGLAGRFRGEHDAHGPGRVRLLEIPPWLRYTVAIASKPSADEGCEP
jgi:hypothetical protein